MEPNAEPAGDAPPAVPPAEVAVVAETPAPAKPPPVGDLPLSPPAGPPGRMTDAELAQYDATSIRLIDEKMLEIDEAKKEFDDLNERAKAAKGVWQALDEQLHRLIKERREARGKPIQKTLLHFTGERPATPVEDLAPAAESGPDQLENLWREYPIDRLTIHGMTLKDAEKLAAGVIKRQGGTHPVLTVGDLADWTSNPANPGFERRATDFDGIGPGAATRISDALELFWKWWPAGGRDEFARERGLVTHADDAAEPEGRGGAAGEGGGGDLPGEPAGPAAGTHGDAARDAEARG